MMKLQVMTLFLLAACSILLMGYVHTGVARAEVNEPVFTLKPNSVSVSRGDVWYVTVHGTG